MSECIAWPVMAYLTCEEQNFTNGMQEQFGCGYMDGRSDGRVGLGTGAVWAWIYGWKK